MSRTIGGETFSISFSYDGKVRSILSKQKEIADVVSPAKGFYLSNGHIEIPLTQIELQGDLLICANESNTQRVTFKVDCHTSYIAFRLVETFAVPMNEYSLHFTACAEHLHIVELDYMTESSLDDNNVTANFYYLYHHNPVDPLGGFVLYHAESEEVEDDILLSIWVEQGLTHPKANMPWTKENARKWVDDFLVKFADRSQMMVKAKSEEELYAFTPYLEQLEARQVYLFTDTWRPDAFWSMTDTNWAINTRVFPKGKESLRQYSDYLEEHGMNLALHYVSGGIGFFDPLYIGEQPDHRLASWGKLEVAQNASQEETTLVLTPNQGVEVPYTCNQYSRRIKMPGMAAYITFQYLLVENEIVRFEDITIDKQGNWVLTNCQRGMFHTNAAAHLKKAEVMGLIAPYDTNFLPDNDSDMLVEMAEQYAALINDCNIAHTEFDGAEIHRYQPWGFRKFTNLIYGALDHAVTAHTSSANAPRSFFHYRLNCVNHLVEGDCAWGHINHHAHIKPYAHSRKSTNFFESHFNMSLGHQGTALGIALPEPMFGESLAELETHGDTARIIDVVTTWKNACKRMDSAMHDWVEGSFYHATDVWATKYNQHRKAEHICVIDKVGEEYQIMPTYVMHREHGDISWQFAQEFGCLSPRQFVRAEETLSLVNPAVAQKPSMILQMLWSQDEMAPAMAQDQAFCEPEKLIGEYDFFADNNLGDDTHIVDARPNIDITPHWKDVTNAGDMVLSETDAGLQMELHNTAKDAFLDAEYGASYPAPITMKNHRGVAITLIGDGSGAVFLLKVAKRDYPVKIDFVGEKTIVVPHGEAAWYQGDWGWRMKTKFTKYDFTKTAEISIGYLPPQTDVKVTVVRIVALREEPCVASALSVSANKTALSLQSKVGIASGDIIYYNGIEAYLYDKNWNEKEQLECDGSVFAVRAGENVVQIHHDANANPYFELQLITCGQAKKI